MKKILLADALISGGTGLVMAFGAATLAGLLGIPEGLLRYAGWSLVPFAIVVGALSRRDPVPRAQAAAVVAANAAWVAASAAVLVLRVIEPSGLGYAFVIGQAAVVAVLAELQYAALGRARTAAA